MWEGCQRVLQEERVRRGCLFFFEGDVEVDGGAPFHGDLYRGALQIDECRVAVCLGCDAAVGDDVPDVEVGIAEDVYGCLEPSAFDDGDVDEGVAVAAAGMYFICINEGFSINKGDLIVLACAVVFAVHIMAIERFTQLVDPVRMSAIQFFVCGMLSLPVIIWAEQPELSAITAAWLPLAHAGIMSCGIAYTLQIAYVNVILASILLSLESVFSVLAGWMFLGETLSMREIGGCVLVFAAILLAQMPERK